jgi:hypothetical protein
MPGIYPGFLDHSHQHRISRITIWEAERNKHLLRDFLLLETATSAFSSSVSDTGERIERIEGLSQQFCTLSRRQAEQYFYTAVSAAVFEIPSPRTPPIIMLVDSV